MSSQMLAAVAVSILGVASVFYPVEMKPDYEHYEECVLLHLIAIAELRQDLLSNRLTAIESDERIWSRPRRTHSSKHR